MKLEKDKVVKPVIRKTELRLYIYTGDVVDTLKLMKVEVNG